MRRAQVSREGVEAQRLVQVDRHVLALVDLAGCVVGGPAVEDDHRGAKRQNLLDEVIDQEGLPGARHAGDDGVRQRTVEEVAGDSLAARVGVELRRRLAAGVVAVQGQQVGRRQGRDASASPQHLVLGILEVQAQGQALQEELVPDDGLGSKFEAQAPAGLGNDRDRRGHGTVGSSPQNQMHPRVQDGRGGVAHHGVEVVPQLPAFGVFLAEHGVALDVGETALLPEHRPLVVLVGYADLGDQGERCVRQRLPGCEGLGAFRGVQA